MGCTVTLGVYSNTVFVQKYCWWCTVTLGVTVTLEVYSNTGDHSNTGGVV